MFYNIGPRSLAITVPHPINILSRDTKLIDADALVYSKMNVFYKLI